MTTERLAARSREPGLGYPIVLRLDGRRVLVVGGGKLAARRAAGLLEANARVVVVSPAFAPAFRRLVPSARLTCLERPYQSSDVAEAALVLASSDDPKLNARVRADARQAGVLVAIADDPESSDFVVPAAVRRRDLLLTVSGTLARPGLVGQLRRELDLLMPDDVATLVRLLAKTRHRARGDAANVAGRRELIDQLLDLHLLSRSLAERSKGGDGP